MLARLLGFILGNRGGLAPKIDSTSVRNAYLLLKGPKCRVSRTLEGSPRYRSGSCAICTGPSSLHNNVFAHGTVTNDDDRRTMTVCHDQRAWPNGPN